MDALFPCCNLRQDTILHQNKLLRQTKEQTAAIHRQTQEAFIAASVFFLSSRPVAPFSLPCAPNHFTVSPPSWPPMYWPHASPLVVTAAKIHMQKKIFPQKTVKKSDHQTTGVLMLFK
jgi:hypothetical protein